MKNETPLSQWDGQLTGEGFKRRGDTYRLNGVSVEIADRWFMLKAAADSLPEQRGQRGFWQWIADRSGSVLLFEFPQSAVSGGDDSEWADAEPDTSLGAFLRWALASKASQIPNGWQPPARELVESWLPEGALTVQRGGILRQGELIVTTDRWALRFPILPNLPAELIESRRKWLELVLSDAQRVCRMVRIGIAEDLGNPSVTAETDFSGAPHSQCLFLAGLDGVRHVVEWLAESVERLADANVASEALAIHPQSNPNPSPERKTHEHHEH